MKIPFGPTVLVEVQIKNYISVQERLHGKQHVKSKPLALGQQPHKSRVKVVLPNNDTKLMHYSFKQRTRQFMYTVIQQSSLQFMYNK